MLLRNHTNYVPQLKKATIEVFFIQVSKESSGSKVTPRFLMTALKATETPSRCSEMSGILF